MFVWDFSAIFAVALILALSLVLVLWVRYNLTRDGQVGRESVVEYFRQCRFCGYTYLDYFQRSPCRCPRCLSYQD